MTEKQFLTASELAEKAKVSVQYVTSQCRAGVIKAQKVGRDWVISVREANRWLSQRE